MLEGTFTLDEILGNPTDLPIAEHAVDTAGQTLALFAAFDLVGLRFAPRIRDLPSRRLYRLGPAKDLARFPHAGSLLSRPIQTDLIVSQWDELLRLGASLKFGHATASLLLSKLQAGSRHNALARGLLEYGRLIRTLFIRYLADVELRRRVHRQLNKGESLNALRRICSTPTPATSAAATTTTRPNRPYASPSPPTPWGCSTPSTSKTPSTPSKPKGAPSTSRPPPTFPGPRRPHRHLRQLHLRRRRRTAPPRSPTPSSAEPCELMVETHTARLVLVCGLPGSGKTTLARRLEETILAVRLCPDEWMADLGL